MADQEKQLDQLLDSLLANYADAEPGPGFQTRLLAALRESKPSFRFGWLWAAAAAIVTAVALFAVYNSRVVELPLPPSIKASGTPVLSPTTPVPVPKANRHPQKLTIEPPLVSTLEVRQEVFPTPVPLSEQERLMLQYLRGTPREEIISHAHEDKPAEQTDPLLPESQRIRGTEIFNTR